MQPARIFLVGLSGSGKSTVGGILAQRLGWEFADSDALIEAAAGVTIPELFRRDGEVSFREREAAVLGTLALRDKVVVATGGGAITNPASRAAIATGFVAWLRITPGQAAARLEASPATEERPLLAGDALARLRQLEAARRPLYTRADAVVDAASGSPAAIASRLADLYRQGAVFGGPVRLESGSPVAARVITPGGAYPVIVQDGALDALGAHCRDTGLGGRAFLLTDTAVGPLFAERALASLRTSGYTAESFAFPGGEEHKTLATVAHVYDWLIAHRVERGDFAVCLGGGVVTDLGGFAAATCLRGIAFVHVPTTTLAMVDASVGGKTGVDHPGGKNLVGVFAQPRAVVIDPGLLQTLPARHLAAGWAEVVKHGLILDADLVESLEAAAGTGAPLMSPELIARSVAIKAEVVSEDEREAGRRTLLNYGHTIGHALEAVTGYSTYLHGEAVAVGMHAAGRISVDMGLLEPAALERQQRLLAACGLPARAPGVDIDAVVAATLQDKKVRAGRVRWVLLAGIGRAVTHDAVPEAVVRRAAEAVLA
jgi:3-dehydroquinate synthase